ncbi:MAG: ATP-binding cassette domain-containing protein [Xylanivirga thermophila]|jgi:Fe-S cluster assembly ATP-binding protein|uniref:ABC transporter ATP-binding protein n=1 Tax=Xylanivirga thermophila TaxID=2496273 RepID=UPI00101E062B|nr:ATP-binding cassette domain-containing protein [Xylanivirga thermophila]
MLDIKDVSLTIDDEEGQVDILKNINLTLDSGKIYVITGPNGSGKSSLAKTIMGIYTPTSGNLIFNGQDITQMDISERANLGLGYAFQQPPRFKGITVRKLLELSSRNGKNVTALCDLLMDVGLCAQDYLSREIDGSLSGGELKRIELASVIARDLKVALFDEPEAGIDLWSFQRLAETFEKMHRRSDTTIIIISHQERILNLADEVIVMNDGEVIDRTNKTNFFSKIDQDANCLCKQGCEKGAGFNAEYYRQANS